MQYGISSLLFSDVFTEASLPLLDKCRNFGYDFVEIVPFDLSVFPPAKVRNACYDLGMDVYLCYGLGPEHNLISPDVEVRKSGIEFSKRLIDICNEAGAKALNGMIHCTWGYVTGAMPTADEWRWGVDAFRRVAEYAKSTSDIILGIEVVNRFETHFINTCADAVKFIRQVDIDNVRVHLDTFHMIREETSFREAVLTAGDLLGHVHACENQRGIPGTGLVPWVEFFTALKEIGYDSGIAVESFDANMERIAKLCSIWRPLADSPEQLAIEGLKFIKQVKESVWNT